MAPVPFEGLYEGRLLAAHVGAGALHHLDVEAEGLVEYAVSQEAEGACIGDGLFHALDGKGVFAPYIDEALRGAHRIAGDDHPFEELMGVAFQDEPVLERARLSFVGVADDEFLLARRLSRKLPLHAGGKGRASPSRRVPSSLPR